MQSVSRLTYSLGTAPPLLGWVLSVAFSIFATDPVLGQSIEEIDRIICIVNDDVIVSSELDRRIEQVRTQIQDSGAQAPPYQILQKQVLDRLVLDRLQIQLAETTGIIVSEEQLNQTMSDMARRNNLTLREFRDAIRQDGYDYSLFREQIREQLVISQVRQQYVLNRVVVSERDVDNFLAMQEKLGSADFEYRLSHILIATPEGASAAAIAETRDRAQSVLQRLQDGETFGQIAVSESDGQRAFEGGDLGWKRTAQLPTIFINHVPQMEPGDTSDIIKSASGFHIIQLTEVRGHSQQIITQTLSRHILIRPNELISDEDAELRLRQLILRVETGEDFGELARTHSDDQASAINNGELGWLNPGDLIPQFGKVTDSLAPGEVSAPFRTQYGWHIIQVIDRREYDNTEAVTRAKAREQIRERKAEEEGQAWLRQLRDQAYVECRLDQE